MMTLSQGAPGYALPLFTPPRADVMIDLETWGTKPGCAIRSIGAVLFNPYGEGIDAEFYRNVSRASCDEWGLTVDPQTEMWWANQSKAAREALDHDQASLVDAVKDFEAWYKSFETMRVWAHGSVFDVPIWETACLAVGGRQAPWGFRDVRDTRTIFDVAGINYTAMRSGVDHHALDDARSQARAVQRAFRKIVAEGA